MHASDPPAYPPILADLLRQLPLAPLGPGKPREDWRPKLEAAMRDLPPACRAGLWLAFDFLDESHEISQGLHTAEGSYWHALMHRREPDYGNSKYWFKRVGTHPVFESLREEAARLGWKAWDAMAFVDLCEANAAEGPPKHQLCREVQRAEWQALFEWCFHRATP